MHQASGNTFRLQRATNFRSIQELAPTKLYWILFPKKDLRQAGKTAKRILTKEKLDKQLTGQSSSSPFMSIREGHSRRVSFQTREDLGNNIDKLSHDRQISC